MHPRAGDSVPVRAVPRASSCAGRAAAVHVAPWPPGGPARSPRAGPGFRATTPCSSSCGQRPRAATRPSGRARGRGRTRWGPRCTRPRTPPRPGSGARAWSPSSHTRRRPCRRAAPAGSPPGRRARRRSTGAR
ncbi:MAG: hypothetical protein EOO21_02770 [Comamonadaceae bacterium]|nr:MAG: hypothetical protein EOO21_02770 [Comamonadaceae bacterium]